MDLTAIFFLVATLVLAFIGIVLMVVPRPGPLPNRVTTSGKKKPKKDKLEEVSRTEITISKKKKK